MMGSTTGIVLVSSPFKNSPSRFLWSILLLLSVFSYPPEVHSTVDETLLEHRSNNNGPPITLASYDRISTNPACQSEVTRICGKRPSDTLPDFDALECILNQRRNEVEELSSDCNHAMWLYRKEITGENGFTQLTKDICFDDFQKTGCWNTSVVAQPGFNLVTCIIDFKDRLEKLKCQRLITRLEGVIFADYEVIGRFADKCAGDIQKFVCGRNDISVQSQAQRLPNSQGKTIECLSDHIQELHDECAIEILRVAELQVDDFHLDRALYFACRDDREKFCSRVQAGNGRVYKCLLRHKLEQDMSNDCRDQVYRRQKLGWQDYKASGVVISCRNEIKKYKCRRGVETSDKHVRLSQILLCLENEFHKGQDINGDCIEEIKMHRKSLMDDHSLTPELLTACAIDKQKFCANKGIHGKTLHCLMAHAQIREHAKRLQPPCMAELVNLLKMSDVSTDWTVDPVLEQNCRKVVEKSICSTYPANKVLECLVNLLSVDSGNEGSIMTDDCETTLIQIQYFMAREFTIDSSLYESCGKEAREICHAKDDWADDPNNHDPDRGRMVLSCLYRNSVPQDTSNSKEPLSAVKLSSQCLAKVKETLRQRALNVKLLPDIEEPCMEDLSMLCSAKTGHGQELSCLQDHLEELSPKCQEAVATYTQLEMKSPTIDPFIWKHCHEVIEQKCSEDKSDDQDLYECLVEQKHDMKNKKCRISIEHLQLIRLKQIKFSPKFKSQCEADVIRYCSHKKLDTLTPAKLVSCLSEIIRKDIVTENTLRVSKGCRKQVRFLLASKVQLESAAPETAYSVCSSTIKQYCSEVPHGDGRVLECLRKHESLIPKGSDCYIALFDLEKQVDFDPGADVVLNTECETEVKFFCPGKQDNLLQCLKHNVDKEGFNQARCGKVVRDRMIEQSKDSRLNPRLQRACKLDVEKFCGRITPGQGRIIGCLKQVLLSPKTRLTTTCNDYIKEMMERAAKEDVQYDSDLYATCKIDIEKLCKRPQGKESDGKDGQDNGDTEECLKLMYRNDAIQNLPCKEKVAQLIQAAMIDIHTDPILNQACAVDLARHCEGVPPGEGRLLNCLLNELHDEQEKGGKGLRLAERCKNLLQKRTALYQKAGAVGKMEFLQDLIDQVQISPHKSYFLSVTMALVGLIFIFGLFCGRATHKRTASKNK